LSENMVSGFMEAVAPETNFITPNSS
jgi:hypothetical protein